MTIDIINMHEAIGSEQAKCDADGTRFAPIASLPGGLGADILEVAPHTSMGHHYHRAGADLFFILSGDGVLYTAQLAGDGKTQRDIRRAPIKAGDVYGIDAGVVHAIENHGDTPLRFINIAPPTHGTSDAYYLEK